MKRKILFVQSIVWIIMLGTFLLTSVFAWMSFIDHRNFAGFTIGDLNFTSFLNNDVFLEELDLEDVVFVDFEKDIIENRYGIINELATTIKVIVALDYGSYNSQVIVNVVEPEEQKGLMLLIVYEGMNLGVDHVFETDFSSVFATIFSDLDGQPVSAYRERIALHNENALLFIRDQIIVSGESIGFQLVFWGDYDMLLNPEEYEGVEFSLDLIVEVVQQGAVNGDD